ncbi:MAG: ABC-F family ATP-binding cassette domain-containing protein [Acidobacteria bacterium]|nr:ABC-F family ATP-binding cassette domain-containing protein [Acidobacteriota bacterium]
MSYLSTHQLSFAHHPGINLFQGITMAINPGDRIGLAGANGCGKTTFLRLLAGELEPGSGKIIRRNGIRIRMLHRPEPAGLSSGQQTREALAGAMREEADVYLLDEPTNHLDVAARDWLAHWLMRRQISCIIVSHDRAFLNRVTTRTLLLERGRAVMHEGNYDFAMDEHDDAESRQRESFDTQQRRIAAAERAAEQRDRLSAKVAKAPPGAKLSHDFYRRKAAKVARTGRILRERRQLEATVAKPWEEQAISHLDFAHVPSVPAIVVHASGLRFGHPGSPVMGPVDIAVHRYERWSVTGPNGCGKTTLFRALLNQLPAVAGEVRWSAGARAGYYSQEH